MPAALLGLAGVLVSLSVAGAWVSFGRPGYPLSALLIAPLYAARKIPLYVGLLGRRQRDWVRTKREPGPRSDR